MSKTFVLLEVMLSRKQRLTIYYYTDNQKLILSFQQIYRCSKRMVLSLRTMCANTPHHWCGGLAQSLRGVIYSDDNNPFGLKKGL